MKNRKLEIFVQIKVGKCDECEVLMNAILQITLVYMCGRILSVFMCYTNFHHLVLNSVQLHKN